jgi:hypothetical protein
MLALITALVLVFGHHWWESSAWSRRAKLEIKRS